MNSYAKFGGTAQCAPPFSLYLRKTDGGTVPPCRARVNPISGRLLATPISGKGGLFRTPPPLRSPVLTGRFSKIQTAFVSPQHDLHF